MNMEKERRPRHMGVLRINEDGSCEHIPWDELPKPKPIDRSKALPYEELSWERIVEEEPEVAGILATLQAGPNRYPYQRWHAFVDKTGTSPKARLAKLVGWHARNPRLRSAVAYEMTMKRMWSLVL
jgi:hypothetical protein